MTKDIERITVKCPQCHQPVIAEKGPRNSTFIFVGHQRPDGTSCPASYFAVAQFEKVSTAVPVTEQLLNAVREVRTARDAAAGVARRVQTGGKCSQELSLATARVRRAEAHAIDLLIVALGETPCSDASPGPSGSPSV